jgi:RNA polymerase sigma-70 factor, ECF subfamily
VRGEFVEVIRRFYELNRDELYTYAVSLTRDADAAEDVIHTVFCNLLKRNSAPREMRSYALRCVRNAATDLVRRNGRERHRNFVYTSPGEAPDPHLQAEMDDALQRLSGDERECIVLKVYTGLTFKEIAALRRVSINTAASWYRRGLEKMKAILDGGDSS